MLTIKNKHLSISVQKKGAELCSIKSVKTGKEYMWNANPDTWGSYAPVLFPIIGGLKNGIVTHNGHQYAIPKHGFIRNNENLVSGFRDENEIVFQLTDNALIQKYYPFHFTFEIAYKLIDNRIEVNHTITNNGAYDMFFSLGGHPAFVCPRNSDEKYSDYYLEFEFPETDETWELSSNGLTNGSTRPVLQNTTRLPLHEQIFAKDALIFKNLKSKRVSLASEKSKERIDFSFHDFEYLGIWAKPGGHFVCIEPWNGITDDENTTGKLSDKEGIMKLLPGATYTAKYSIEISE